MGQVDNKWELHEPTHHMGCERWHQHRTGLGHIPDAAVRCARAVDFKVAEEGVEGNVYFGSQVGQAHV